MKTRKKTKYIEKEMYEQKDIDAHTQSCIQNAHSRLETERERKAPFACFLSKLQLYYKERGIRNPLPNFEFLEWLIGFTEGDGCFFVNKRGECAFLLIQGLANRELLHRIANTLQLGHVLQQGKRTFRFIVQKRQQVELVLELFDGNIVLPSRRAQFQKFWHHFHRKRTHSHSSFPVMKKESTPIAQRVSLDTLWLLGFVEAEGCFTISLLSNSNAFRIRFIVSQKGDVNLPILSSLISLFGTGRIEGHSAKDNYSFVVSGIRNMKHVYPYFDKFLEHFQGIKKTSYVQLKRLHLRIAQKEHLDPKIRPSLVELSRRINSVSRESR